MDPELSMRTGNTAATSGRDPLTGFGGMQDASRYLSTRQASTLGLTAVIPLTSLGNSMLDSMFILTYLCRSCYKAGCIRTFTANLYAGRLS